MMWTRFLLHLSGLLQATAFLACSDPDPDPGGAPSASEPETAACVLEEDHPDWQILEAALAGPENKQWSYAVYFTPGYWESARGHHLVCYYWADRALTCEAMPKGWLGTKGER